MPAVSVVIPNYNGQQLLEKHLPLVLKSMRDGDELIVIDDCSTDRSWQWLGEFFSSKKKAARVDAPAFEGERLLLHWSVGQKKGDVTLLRNSHNLRFALTCNAAVVQASHSLIYLVNSDVSPHTQTIQRCVEHFSDPTVFAVGCLEHEKGEHDQDVIGGKNILEFKRGMFMHNRATSFESGETAWASGGSSMFDRQKWLELGGFDVDYYPAYWEDVDLSFRAKKKGWKVLFDAKAEVDHNHESTNTTAFGQKKMTKMSWQHAQTFVTKNGTFFQKLQYLLWQPYWWIKGPVVAPIQLQIIIFGLLLLIAAALRLYALAEVPHGMTWDEAAIGYNGWSISTTGRDEWLNKLPLSFRSFGDYKAPLAIYIVGAFSRLLGPTLFAVRLPFALSGIAAVVGMMLLTKLLWRRWSTALNRVPRPFPSLNENTAALLAGAVIAVSPWHVHFSRVGFESGMALNFVIWGVVGLVWLFLPRKHTSKRQSVIDGLVGMFAATSLASSLYAYHSSKIVVPLLLVAIGIFFFKDLRRKWQGVLSWLILFALFLAPLVYDTLYGKGGERFQQASIFRLGLSPVEQILTIISHFAAHYTPAYLVHGITDTLRHGSGKYGVLYLPEFFFVMSGLLGGAYSWFSKRERLSLPYKLILFAVIWIGIGTLPSAIGIDVPHSNRMLLALPGFIFLAVAGWEWIAQAFEENLWAPALIGTTVLLYIFFVSSYLNYYYTTFKAASADDFKDGYVEAVEYAVKYEPEVEKILFTSVYQQPYIYTLLVRKTSVYDYHNGALIKYFFTDKVTEGDLLRPNTLVVAPPDQINPALATHVVKGSDGQIRFVIVKTP